LAVVDYICRRKGGEGAVREMIDIMLAAQQRTASSAGKKHR
jgi:3-deoxy-D-manno-octulosonate 8-phosphate phosphatase KdsC-like HAD superfamily phosphatase